MKTCTKCGESFPATIEFFHKHAPSKDGLKPRCKKCHRIDAINFYGNHKEVYKTNALTWAKNHPDRRKLIIEKWNKLHPAERKNIRKKWVHLHPDKMRSYWKDQDERRLAIPVKRIRIRMSHLISQYLLRRGYKTNGKAWLVDYDAHQLKSHLENLFQPGMTWKNYGRWHIDHKKPAALFEFTSPDDPQFQECFALSNIQPLWAEDNRKKGSKWDS